MKTKTDTRRTKAHGLPRDDSANDVLEFVFNDEEEAFFSEHTVLSHQCDIPALQEYLQEMSELDLRVGGTRSHGPLS